MRPDISASGVVSRIDGPLLFLQRTVNVGLNTAVEVEGPDGTTRLGRIAAVETDRLVVEVLQSTTGLSLGGTRVRFTARPLTLAVGPGLLGRIFDGLGRPIDGGPPVPAVQRLPIDGAAINPAHRELPRDFIETGVTTIDLMNSLVRGQKLPIFSGGGLPHDRLAVEIASHARLRHGADGDGGDDFAIVFAGIGVPYDSAEFFRKSLEQGGALERTALFLNLASDSSTQRLLTPRFALTAAEYLAFVEGKQVLAILTDMTNYAEALREVSSSKGEIPSRKGFPGYMYSDLASLFERAGCIHGRKGTLTQLSILTMPADDIGHPIPDLTGYITEGQIVASKELHRAGIYPPINVGASLSRLMNEGIGADRTREDHKAVSDQCYATYAEGRDLRGLVAIVGKDALSERDKKFLDFADAFENRFVRQGKDEDRDIETTLEIAWQLLATIPENQLSRIDRKYIEKYHPAHRKSE
jgi:V/A-type H+/Na+-transporting ATPase subunit B